MSILDNLYANTLGQHFDNTGNLRAAARQGLISEPQYKTMSGYDASQTIPGITDNPVVTGATSGAYNLAKSILSPEDYFNPDTYQPQIGPIDSTVLNTLGSLGLSPQDKEKYEGIISLDPKSLGMGQWSEEDLTDFSGVYDDDETGTIDVSDPKFNQAGIGIISGLNKLFGPKIASYLKNKAITKVGKDIVGPAIKKTIPVPTPSPWHPGSGGNGGSGGGLGKGVSPTGSDVEGTPFNMGGLARLLYYGGLV